MHMALVDCGIGGKAIEIFFSIHIINPHALSPLDDHIEGMIIVRAVLLFHIDKILCIHKVTSIFLSRWSSGRSPYRDHQISKIILVSGGLDMPFAESAQGYSTTG